jgi:hypothetical protein
MIELKNGIIIKRITKRVEGYHTIGGYYLGITTNGITYGFTKLDIKSGDVNEL